jgi:hypothetical protein
MNVATDNWLAANQRHLTAALAGVRAALERHVAKSGETEAVGQIGSAPAIQLETDMADPPPLERLCTIFGLSSFERDLLLLCAGVEFDAAFAPLCAAAQGDPLRTYPTFSLALAALAEPHWSALTPAAPLRRWRLIEVGAGSALSLSPLRIDENVLHYLAGVRQIDERLSGLVQEVAVDGTLVPSHVALADQIADIWSRAEDAAVLPVVQLCGAEAGDRRQIAAAACATLGLGLCVLVAPAIPLAPAESVLLTRLWEREAALGESGLLLECDDIDPAEAVREQAIGRLIDGVVGPLLVAGDRRRRLAHRPLLTFDVPRPTATEQRAVWHDALGAAASGLNGHVAALTSQFNLSTATIRTAGAQIRSKIESRMDDLPSTDLRPLADALWDSCRAQARPRLDHLAQRIEPAADWNDLVLPETQRQLLREMATHVRRRVTVYESWGFANKGARGLGISVLFSGASGTGKTMAAEVLANELRLDLYRIDLSSVVSKYIGETEKNLRRVFDAAEVGGAVLLFDEADALFGKRSEVKDSHDRYANIEVSYLLQRMEAYRGLAILTTNMKDALDHAFLRRIRFVVQFPFPDTGQRAEIWRRIFPASTPTEDLDVDRLARLNVAGGNIRNIALHAAFLAADVGEPVRMTHLLRAAQGEYTKLEKPLTETEIRGWGR